MKMLAEDVEPAAAACAFRHPISPHLVFGVTHGTTPGKVIYQMSLCSDPVLRDPG